MKHLSSTLLLLCICALQLTNAQSNTEFREAFFKDTSMLNLTIVTNTSKLFKNNKQGFILPAAAVTKLADGTNVNDRIEIEVRGHFRHDYCYVPPLKVIFNFDKSSVLSSLKSLKLVNECKVSNTYDQYILKEFIAYKIYNLITDMSFRVRLLTVNFADSLGKKKPTTVHSFLLEDIKDVAKRNDCEQYRKGNLVTEATNRRQMTMVAVFEYLIGNTDWAVSVNHNTKLIYSAKDTTIRPYVIPYDFDYSGFVNTEYAIPDERLNIENVRQRLYRGFPRTMQELNNILYIFQQQKEKIYATVNNFDLLTPASKRDLTGFLDDFYKIIKDPKAVKDVFITNARTE
ncbi:MAG TPA: hypothetical protein VIH86_01320 [Puia sp.]